MAGMLPEWARMVEIGLTLIGMAFDFGFLYMLIAKKLGKDDMVPNVPKRMVLLGCFGIALIATLGSLYLSEIAGLEPCKLCWFQRIFMYPLAILFLIAYLRNYTGIFNYTLPLSITGGAIALYHYLLQMYPQVFSPGTECQGVSCTIVYSYELGFITIPFMAFIAFLGITLLSLIYRR